MCDPHTPPSFGLVPELLSDTQIHGEELGSETLYRIISAVAQGPDLDRVLPPVVDLLVEATACHACFVYLREGDVLRMRAASPIFAHAVGNVTIDMEEGLCGWVARHRTPAFIPDNAMGDPRNKYVPELEEERFQSMIAVPLLGRGEAVIGVVVLHTEAPREFGKEVTDFLVHVGSLVAGAIGNAGLYDEKRRQVAVLSALTALGERIAGVHGREALYRVTCEGVRELLSASACTLRLYDGNRNLEVVAMSSDDADARPDPRLSALRAGPGERLLAVPVIAGQEELGMLLAERPERWTRDEQRWLDAVANQLAVALQKVELIERLTEENIVGDLFDALAEGRAAAAESRARAAGYDLTRPHVVAVLEPLAGRSDAWEEVSARAEAQLRRLVPGALCDQKIERLRALLPLRAGDSSEQVARLDEEFDCLGATYGLAAGRSMPRRGLGGDLRSLTEAATAVQVVHSLLPAGGARGYEKLGVYRYLARLAGDHAPDERHAAAVAMLVEYDQRRRSQLTVTLERHLAGRGAIATTARALFVHPNTLRQRLERIEQITGLVLADEDLLSLELAVKLAHLSRAG